MTVSLVKRRLWRITAARRLDRGMEKRAGESRPRGQIRPRGNAATEAKARRALTRLTAQVDEKRHAKTNASFQVAMETWLRTHEIEETTRASYEQYARVRLYRRSATSQSIA